MKESSFVDDGELRSFKDRLTRLDPSNPAHGDIEDLKKSIDSMMRSKDRYNNAISVNHTSMLALMEITFKEHPKGSDRSSGGHTAIHQPLQMPTTSHNTPNSSSISKRRVVKRTVSASPQVPSISEDRSEQPTSDIISTQSLSKPISRSRRRVTRTPSAAESEYTVVSNADEARPSNSYDMDQVQSTHIRTFSGWFKDNYKDDPSFQVILSSAANSRTTDNELSRDILEYIKSRKNNDISYDPYDELSDPDSKSSKWIAEYMKRH